LRQQKHIRDNCDKTAKYSWWNFIPINLVEQFMKASNVYFFDIMIMQMIPEISISGG